MSTGTQINCSLQPGITKNATVMLGDAEFDICTMTDFEESHCHHRERQQCNIIALHMAFTLPFPYMNCPIRGFGAVPLCAGRALVTSGHVFKRPQLQEA
ncbi:hypothetical protein DK867_16320 [Ochrobactrum sp. POC9]|nr:hypothetical protein DK867_16320 [Ochrobactrum sp. POC9]